MRLKKLDLFGFKSFPEKLGIEIGDGIMAVVGPNGCGKSNIVDAIRWALGEQSARVLRGDRMDDVIFAGSKTRKPLGMAQVVLTFSNDDGALPIDFSEVTVTRRVFRSGESEYLLNKEVCRLKDIREMFRGTGVGSHSYSLIERSQVDSVITDGSTDRRLLLEEAAGITNYKARKREALRKLEATENDLVRLNDIITEVEREARSLGRQVGKAKRYHRWNERVKDLDVSVSRRKHRDLLQEERGLKEVLSEQKAEEAKLQATRGTLEAEVETIRADLLRKGREVSEAESKLREVEGRLADVREKISVLSERRRGLSEKASEAENRAEELERRIRQEHARRSSLESEREAAGERVEERSAEVREKEEKLERAEKALAELRERLEDVKRPAVESLERAAQLDAQVQRHRSEVAERTARIERESRRREELLARRSSLEERLQAGRSELERIVDALRECRNEEESRAAKTENIWEDANKLRENEKALSERAAALQSRLKLMQEIQDSYECLGEGVMVVMKDEEMRSRAKIVGPLAGLLSVPEEMVAAVEATLGETLQYLVSEDLGAAAEVFAEGRSKSKGGVTVVPLPAGVETLAAEQRENLLKEEGVIAWLPEACTESEEPDPAVRSFLSRAFLVSDEKTALRLSRRYDGTKLLFVTRGGFAVEAGASLLRIGGSTKAAGLICRAGEIEKCQEDLRDAEASLRDLKKKREELERVRTASLESLEEMRQKVRGLQQACVDKERDVSTARAQLEACGEELDVLHERISTAKNASEEAERAIRMAGSKLRDAESAKESCEEDLRRTEAKERELEAERTAAQRAYHEAHGLWAEAERAVREIEAEMARLAASAEDLAARREAKLKEAEGARESSSALEAEIEGLEEELVRSGNAKRDIEEDLSGLREDYEKSEAVAAEKEHSAKEARGKAQEATNSLHDTEIRLTQVSTEASGLRQRVMGEHGVNLDAYAPAEDCEQSLEEMEADLEHLRAKVAKLGAVNLLAVEDYKRCRERLEFLTTQRTDLVQARESLLEAIEKINITASSLFVETFEKVRENFKRTFSTLFKGGEAEISLVGEDPLEADVDIYARPGGKKFQSLKLLSGGERALTAISLLFAVYLVKPSPFCILDEVDAPLDDVNVDKFVSMIREFSSRTQFIVVTHNKSTMAAANRLYGITMAEPGTSKLVSVSFDELGNVRQPETETEALAAAVV